MALTAWEAASVARNEGFQRRVGYYMTKGAVAVIAEAPATDGHAARKTYADTVLDATASTLLHGLAALGNATVVAGGDASLSENGGFGIADNDLEFAINEHWNAMSGHETGV